MKRLFVFVLAAVLLVGSVPAKDVRAEDSLSFTDFVEKYISYNEIHTYFSELMNEGTTNVVGYRYNLSDVNNYIFLSCGIDYYLLVFNGNVTTVAHGGGFRFIDGVNAGLAFKLISDNGSFTLLDNNPLIGYSFVPSKSHFVNIICKNFEFDYSFLSESTLQYFDYENDEEFSGHTHSYISKTQAASCAASGRTWEECSCGAIQNEVVIPALGHTLERKEESGSCIEDSRTWEECSVCGAVQNEIITPASGHVWIDKEEAATCTSSGRSWQECGCGEIQNETELPVLEHDDLTYKVVQQPTLTEEGIFTRSCSVCGEIVETGSIPVLTPTPTPTPTLVPSPDLMERTADFSLIVIMVMLLMQYFPLNLFLVAVFLYAAVVVFSDGKKGISKK